MATPADPDVGFLTPARGGAGESRQGTRGAAPYNGTVAALCQVGGVVALRGLRPLHGPLPPRAGSARSGPARSGTTSGGGGTWTVIALRARPPAALVLVPASAPPVAAADPPVAGAEPPVRMAPGVGPIGPGVGPTAIRSAVAAVEAAGIHRPGSRP
jgi:hypothetical protein